MVIPEAAMRRILCATIPVLLAFSLAARAEDWITRDGTIYKDVTVLKVEADAVTIIHHDGGALVPLANLGPDLQARFKYDPAKAQAAAAARAQADQKSIEALQAEKDKQNAQTIAAVQAIAKAAADPKKNASPPTTNNAANRGPGWDLTGSVNPVTHVDNSRRDGGDQQDSRTHYSGM